MLLAAAWPHRAEATTIPVNTTADELNSDGDCSLREAVSAANLNSAVDACPAGTGGITFDTITLAPGATYGLALAGAGENLNQTGDLDVFASGLVRIVGPVGNKPTIDAGDIDRAIHVTSGLTGFFVEVEGVRIENGRVSAAEAGGGGIFAQRNLIVDQSHVTSSVAEQGWGGGIGSSGGTEITATGSEVTDNEAGRGGGGISTVSDNGSPPAGAGGKLAIEDSLIHLNEAGTEEGFSGAVRGGGGILSASAEIEVSSSTISQNTAPQPPNTIARPGGGVRVLGAPAGPKSVTGSAIVSNESSAEGGGMALQASAGITVTESHFGANDASRGGGIHFNALSNLELERSRVEGNSASDRMGGGIYVESSGTAEIVDSSIRNNTAAKGSGTVVPIRGGGGIYGAGTVRLRGTTVANNMTESTGGNALYGPGIYLTGVQGGSLETLNTTISDNHATAGSVTGIGGAIFLDGAAATLRYTTVADNSGGDGPGSSLGEQVAESGAGQLTWSQSIIAGAQGSNLCLSDGGQAFTSEGENVSSGPNCGSAVAGDAFGVDPMLGPLAQNSFGGFLVGAPPNATAALETRALLEGSPAIDRVDPPCEEDPAQPGALREIDQRHLPSPFGTGCDSGAYEVVACAGMRAGHFSTDWGTNGNDVIAGGPGGDLMLGFDGDDEIDALGGGDTACGGPGNDEVLGGSGADKLVGGGGMDTLRGSKAKDTLRGGGGVDRLVGGVGGDRLNGGKANDTLRGGGGNDTMRGGKGKDVLRGGGGRDICIGGPGNDKAIGCEVVKQVP